jgi:hypothetical protein
MKLIILNSAAYGFRTRGSKRATFQSSEISSGKAGFPDEVCLKIRKIFE